MSAFEHLLDFILLFIVKEEKNGCTFPGVLYHVMISIGMLDEISVIYV